MRKVIELKRTCESCPSQWEGKLDNGHTIYIRYRHGFLNVKISKKPSKDVLDAIYGKEIYLQGLGDQWSGSMTFDELKLFTKDILDLSEITEVA